MVKTSVCRKLAAIGIVFLAWHAANHAEAANPPEWVSAAPQSEGFDPDKLEEFQKTLVARGTTSLLVIRHDKVVCEYYSAGWSRSKPHGTASLAKALVGGMGLLLAIDEGRISADDLASKYIPAWKSDPARAAITIRELATHTSGIEDAEQGDIAHEKLTGWKGDFWKRKPDPFSISLHQAPIVFKPGTEFEYSNPGMAVLAYTITASLRGSAQTDLRQLLAERLMDKMGVPKSEWSIGYNGPSDVDGLKLYATWGGGNYSPRAAAAVGRLLMRKGDWDGQRIISRAAVENSLKYSEMPKPPRPPENPFPASGLAWYTNFDHVWSKVPPDAFAGGGASHQILFVVPSLDLVVVRFGASLTSEDEKIGFWGAVNQYIFGPLMGSMTDLPSSKNPGSSQRESKSPYPQSPVIQSLTWAPLEMVKRAAIGSDNWPLTWADDDSMYTAYGDGNGFEPQIAEKLSLGFARVDGPADRFAGTNIRSAIEQTGSGKAGKKGSGMVCVDGKLFLLMRNAHNAQFASSADHGKTWNWADWKFETSFGCPTILNFGRNYSQARDGFVYVYSPDTDSAYEMADRFVLARVPTDRVLKRDAYEFFVGVDSAGRATWSGDIAKRGPVFQYPGHCYRGSVTYDAPIKRYLWWQGGQTDGRFKGGFTIYDAPEPWGPWTTVYHTDQWDTGPGESASLPTKWMSTDGLTLHLVFSGDDSFSVRKAIVETMPGR